MSNFDCYVMVMAALGVPLQSTAVMLAIPMKPIFHSRGLPEVPWVCLISSLWVPAY